MKNYLKCNAIPNNFWSASQIILDLGSDCTFLTKYGVIKTYAHSFIAITILNLFKLYIFFETYNLKYVVNIFFVYIYFIKRNNKYHHLILYQNYWHSLSILKEFNTIIVKECFTLRKLFSNNDTKIRLLGSIQNCSLNNLFTKKLFGKYM